MDMVNRLAGVLTIVDDEAEAVLDQTFLIRHAPCGDQQMSHRGRVLGRQIVNRRDVLLRNDEDMRWRNRSDVAKGERVLVFVDDRCRDFLLEDVAEQAAHGPAAYCVRAWRAMA